MSFDVRLGRLSLPTVLEGVKETVGEQLDSVGAISLPGERAPKQFPLTLPIYGPTSEDDCYELGLRLRRQLRSLLRNPKARLEGLYFNWGVDDELNAWLLVGRGEITEGDGGITFADFKADLTEVTIAGAPRTHRPGRRLEATDRRLSTTARDYRGAFFSTDFAAETAEVRHYLPVGVSDLVGVGDRVVDIGSHARASAEGAVPYVLAATPGEPVTFEQPEADRHKGDVVIWDRRGT